MDSDTKYMDFLKYFTLMYPIKRKIPLSFLKKLHLQGNIEMDETIYITFSAKYYLYQKQLLNIRFFG